MSRLDPNTGIYIKNAQDLKYMAIAGATLASYMEICVRILQAGRHRMTPIRISDLLFHFVEQYAPGRNEDWGFPFMEDSQTYAYPVCISINEELVHIMPSARPIKRGDIVKIDAGLSYKGWCADMARTVIAGKQLMPMSSQKPTYLVSAGSENHVDIGVKAVNMALYNGFLQCTPGNKIKNIVAAIDRTLSGYAVGRVPYLCGHGIGNNLHEPPFIPNNLNELSPQVGDIELQEGMTCCLEPMATLYNTEIIKVGPGFKSKDGATFHAENTILVSHTPRVLTSTEEKTK